MSSHVDLGALTAEHLSYYGDRGSKTVKAYCRRVIYRAWGLTTHRRWARLILDRRSFVQAPSAPRDQRQHPRARNGSPIPNEPKPLRSQAASWEIHEDERVSAAGSEWQNTMKAFAEVHAALPLLVRHRVTAPEHYFRKLLLEFFRRPEIGALGCIQYDGHSA